MAIYLYKKKLDINNSLICFIKKNCENVLDSRKTDMQSRLWQGGKKKGSIIHKGNGLFIATIGNKKFKSFELNNFEMNELKLRDSAEQFLYSKSLEMGIVTNQYKIIFHKKTNEPQYLLVQLSKNYIMLCDYDQLEMIKKYHFFITILNKKKKDKSCYVAYSQYNQNVLFHNQIMGNKITNHINNYPMDNRRCNLKDITIKDSYHYLSLEAQKKAYEWCIQIIKKYKINPMIDISFCISFHKKENVWRSYIKMKGNMIMKSFPILLNTDQNASNRIYKPADDPNLLNKHPDFDRLKSEFETIMEEHGGGFKWI